MLNWIVRNKTIWSFNCVYLNKLFTNNTFLIYFLKPDLELNNVQLLMSRENQTKPNKAKPNQTKPR